MGWGMVDGALPVPLVGSVSGHTVITVLVCLEDWGHLVALLDDQRLPCAFAVQSGYADNTGPVNQKGYFIGVAVGAPGAEFSGNPTELGSAFVVNHGLGAAQFEVESILGGPSSLYMPRRGEAFVVNYNWDPVAGLVKLKQSFDSAVASAAAATFVPTDSAIAYPGANIEFCLGHANSAVSPVSVFPAAASPFYGIAATYYSTTKTAWTAQEMSDFEEEIAAAMATDSTLPIPAGTTAADWVIFDSRMIDGNQWQDVGGVYALRGNLISGAGLEPFNDNNQREQLRNISFPKSGM